MAKRKKKYQKRNESYSTTEVSDLISKYGVDAFTMRFLEQAGIKTSADVDKIESNFDLVAALMPCGPEANKVRTILIDCLNKNGYDTVRFGKPMVEDVKEDRALTNIEMNDLKADSSLNRYFGFKVTDDNKAKAIDYIKTVINKEITNDEMEEIVKKFSLIWRGLEKDDKPMTYKSFRTYLGNYHLSIHILPNRNLIIEEPNRTIGKRTIIPKNKELTKTDIDLAIKKAKDDVREALTEQPYALNEEEVFEAIKRRPAVEASDMKVTVMFNCPICGKETFYSTTVISTLSSIDAIIYCRKCFNKIRVK